MTELADLCRHKIDALLPNTGAVLFRTLPLNDSGAFSEFLNLLGFPPFRYRGGNAVRNARADNVYDASIEPACMNMAPHNELSYFTQSPRLIIFFCAKEADKGGEVVINDTRTLLQRLDPSITESFLKKGLLYQKYLPNEKDCQNGGVSWQTAFFTADKEIVEAYLSEKQMDYEWDAQNALTYRFKGPVTISHPESGETLWFNQSTELHCSYWQDHPYFEQQALSEDHYPSHTYYGDGSPIEREVIDDIRKVLWEKASVLKMHPGDLLILDNVVMQHGRLAFEGARRHEVSLAHWPI
jgi:alpha-ketoglutarate-dependent taurine dioxygenase